MSQSKFRPLGFLAVMTLAAVLVGALVAVDAEAARGGNGGGGRGGNGGGSTATLTASPSSVPAGTSTITISGAGFRANQDIKVGPRGVIPTVWLTTDGNGAFSIEYTPWDGGFDVAGTYYVDARDTNKGTLLATTTFTVYW